MPLYYVRILDSRVRALLKKIAGQHERGSVTVVAVVVYVDDGRGPRPLQGLAKSYSIEILRLRESRVLTLPA